MAPLLLPALVRAGAGPLRMAGGDVGTRHQLEGRAPTSRRSALASPLAHPRTPVSQGWRRGMPLPPPPQACCTAWSSGCPAAAGPPAGPCAWRRRRRAICLGPRAAARSHAWATPRQAPHSSPSPPQPVLTQSKLIPSRPWRRASSTLPATHSARAAALGSSSVALLKRPSRTTRAPAACARHTRLGSLPSFHATVVSWSQS